MSLMDCRAIRLQACWKISGSILRAGEFPSGLNSPWAAITVPNTRMVFPREFFHFNGKLSKGKLAGTLGHIDALHPRQQPEALKIMLRETTTAPRSMRAITRSGKPVQTRY